MKLRIRTNEVELSRDERTAIDGHLRISLGNRSSRFQSAEISISKAPGGDRQLRCRISLRDAGGVFDSVDEAGPDLETAMGWAVWRLIHSLDRRALRPSNTPSVARRSRASRAG